MFQLSQYPVEQISQNFQKKFNGFKERSIPLDMTLIGGFICHSSSNILEYSEGVKIKSAVS